MKDKTFFEWYPFAFDPECDGMALTAWNAATERATAVERERCAAQAEKATKNNRVIVASIDGVPTPACFIATAIRQGNAV